MPSDLSFSQKVINLCSEYFPNSSFLLVPTNDGSITEIDISDNHYKLSIKKLTCRENEYERALKMNLYDDDKWTFDNQTVLVIDGKMDEYREYCFDLTSNDSGDAFTDLMVCEFYEVDSTFFYFSLAMFVSILFLMITFFVYGCVHELRNLHGKSLMSYTFGLIILYSGLLSAQLTSEVFEPGDFLCVFIGYTTFTGLLISFFWLNVMCIDIWSTFKSQLKSRGSEQKRFIFFCIYAFGCPLVLVGITFFIENSNWFPEDIRPMIGFEKCWLRSDKLVEWIFAFGPISIIIAVNIVLYSITAIKIVSIHKETKLIRSGESRKHSSDKANRRRFFLYLRLFIIMGAVWSMEPISWHFEANWFLMFFDVLNCLQGLVVFILFVWTSKVRRIFVQRYRRGRNLPPSTSSFRESSVSSRLFSTIKGRNASQKRVGIALVETNISAPTTIKL